MTDWLTEIQTDRRTDWRTDGRTDQRTHQPTNRPTIQPTDRPTEQPADQQTNQPTDQPTNGPTDQPIKRLTDWPNDQPTDRVKLPKYVKFKTSSNAKPKMSKRNHMQVGLDIQVSWHNHRSNAKSKSCVKKQLDVASLNVPTTLFHIHQIPLGWKNFSKYSIYFQTILHKNRDKKKYRNIML